MNKRRHQWFRYSYRSSLLLPLIWAVGSYGSWIEKGCRPFLPFVSDLDILQPESTIFTVGMTLQGLSLFVLLVFFQQQHALIIKQLQLGKRWTRLQQLSFLPGFVATVSCVGLAWAAWNTHIIQHRNLAYGIFFGGVLWAGFSSLLTWKISQTVTAVQWYFRLRLVGFVLASVLLLTFLYMLSVVFGAADFMIEEYIARTFDQEHFCWYSFNEKMNWAALFEWLFVTCLFFIIFTLNGEFDAISRYIGGQNPDQ